MSEVKERIIARLEKLADEAFDPEDAIDSDGTDQAMRDAFHVAIGVVREEFDNE